MRTAVVLGAIVCLALAGCGAGPPSAESVVRAWSQALNAEDNKGAADLFAPGAEIVQGAIVIRLRTHAEAEAWNSALPCSGRIVAVSHCGPPTAPTSTASVWRHAWSVGSGNGLP